MPRKTNDWIGNFENITEFTGTPLRLRRWAAIACVAGAVERKVWIKSKRTKFYPGMYTILVSPPGVGKSVILNLVRQFWGELEDHKIAAPSVSKASLVDELHDAHRTLIHPGKNPPTQEFHSLKILVSELGVFLPEFANEFMNVLTDIYDGYPYKERKRTKNLVVDIPKPQINLLTGTTPSFLTALLPEGAWDQGFLSRTNIAYAGEITIQSPFDDDSENIDGALKELTHDIKEIADLYGEITITKEAKDFFLEWLYGRMQPVPTHPKLQHYNTRRMGHLLKLMQVAAVNESNKLSITLEHVQRALDWMVDLEHAIPEVFKAMSNGGDAKVMQECWHMLFQFKARFNKGAPHSLLIQFLSERVPTHNVERMIDLMEKAKMIRPVSEKNVGMVYYPQERTWL